MISKEGVWDWNMFVRNGYMYGISTNKKLTGKPIDFEGLIWGWSDDDVAPQFKQRKLD